MGKDVEVAILFADVVGSTQLYEQLGDANPRLESAPLTDADIATLIGTYQYGPSQTERITSR